MTKVAIEMYQCTFALNHYLYKNILKWSSEDAFKAVHWRQSFAHGHLLCNTYSILLKCSKSNQKTTANASRLDIWANRLEQMKRPCWTVPSAYVSRM